MLTGQQLRVLTGVSVWLLPHFSWEFKQKRTIIDSSHPLCPAKSNHPFGSKNPKSNAPIHHTGSPVFFQSLTSLPRSSRGGISQVVQTFLQLYNASFLVYTRRCPLATLTIISLYSWVTVHAPAQLPCYPLFSPWVTSTLFWLSLDGQLLAFFLLSLASHGCSPYWVPHRRELPGAASVLSYSAWSSTGNMSRPGLGFTRARSDTVSNCIEFHLSPASNSARLLLHMWCFSETSSPNYRVGLEQEFSMYEEKLRGGDWASMNSWKL